jgi:hypothetical protein
VVWKHPPSCSKLTGSNVLVRHLLEDPLYPIVPRHNIITGYKFVFQCWGDIRAHDLGRSCIITKVVHHPVLLILEFFLTIQACHRLPLVKKCNILVPLQRLPSAHSSHLGGKIRFVVTKDNYGDCDYEFD